jgi:two-component system, OmpR family, copper resistance phosphate regulon response regulator CusR
MPHDEPMSGSGPRILIVEDEAAVSALLQDGLTTYGFAVEVARDGRTALDRTDSGGFDLLVLDIGLPDLDGFTVLRELRERGHGLPIIILTGRDTVTETVAALEGGADDFIQKPFEFDELLARIRARLRDNGGAYGT